MQERDYNLELYGKMKAEQGAYRNWLLSQEPSEILGHAFEYTMREDIVIAMEEMELSPIRAKALLKSPSPLPMCTRSSETVKRNTWTRSEDPLKAVRIRSSSVKKNGMGGDLSAVYRA